MSLSVPRASCTVVLNSSSEIQQLAIFAHSFVPYLESLFFLADLFRFLYKAQESLTSKPQAQSQKWHLNAQLKKYLDLALSGQPSVDQQLYKFTGILDPVVIFFYMYSGAVAQRKEAEETIKKWPEAARKLFAFLLARTGLPENMRDKLKNDPIYGLYMENPSLQPQAPPCTYFEILGISIRIERSTSGQDMMIIQALERREHIHHHLETLFHDPDWNQRRGGLSIAQLPDWDQRGGGLSIGQLLNTSKRQVSLPFNIGTLCNSLRSIMSGTITNQDTDFQDALKAIRSKQLHATLPPINNDDPVILSIGSEIEFYLMKEMTQRLMQWKRYTVYDQLCSVTWQDLLGCVESNIDPEIEGKAKAELLGNGRITFWVQKAELKMIVLFDRSIFRYVVDQY